MSREVLSIQAVSKQYDTALAVDRVSLTVSEGEIFALLGPNGAGKTTLVRMMMGILHPDRGTIAWKLGGVAPEAPSPCDLGYLPEDRGFYTDVPLLRALAYFGGLRGMARRDALRESRLWLDRFGLLDRAEEKAQALSKGNQQKVQFISAVMHRPKFAVLDEPFSGLDPINQELFLEVIRDLRASGMTIVLSAHQMQLVERIADRILLIHKGREVLTGTLQEIRRQSCAGNTVYLRLGESEDAAGLKCLPSVESVAADPTGQIAVVLRPEAPLKELLAFAAEHYDIREVRTEQSSLHDIFVRAIDGASEPPATKNGGAG